MLPKKHRINKVLFKEIFKKGKTFSFEHLFLRIVSLSTPISLFTFVVSSKVSKKPIIRNKLKKRARYIVKKLLSQIKPGLGVIVFFKPGSEKLSFSELGKEILAVFKKSGIIKS